MILINTLLNYKNIIFDCDGVILNSNHIKTNGFAKLFAKYPKEDVDRIIQYHKRHGGVSRFIKIKYFYEKVLKKNIKDKEITKLAHKYGEITLKDLFNCELTPGFLDLLKFLKLKKYDLFVVSGSDEKDLIMLLKHKNIFNFFKLIKGSPKNKEENFIDIFPSKSDRKKSVYIGDSEYDYKSSLNVGLDFIFMQRFSEWNVNINFLKKNNIKYLFDFTLHL